MKEGELRIHQVGGTSIYWTVAASIPATDFPGSLLNLCFVAGL